MQIVRIGSKGQMVCIAEDGQREGVWYRLTDSTKPHFDKNEYSVGDSVTIKTEKRNNTNMLLYIAKAGSAPVSASTPAAVSGGSYPPAAVKTNTYGKSPEEQNTIKRQAIGHMTSRTLIAMQGMVTEENVEVLIDKLYKKYQQVVG